MFDPDWDAATRETVECLSRLIQAETTNPPGNEERAVKVIQDILEREEVPPGDYHILESAPGRVNLVVRLRGDDSHRPLLMSGHTDVVPVEREHWTHNPFGGEVFDGCVWGRGALDMKGFLAMYLQAFLLARRLKLPLKRDLVLAAVADEEAGFRHGSRFLVDQHRSLIDAEYGVTEGGAMTMYAGKVRFYPIQVAEKGMCWIRMTAKGEPGHGSIPIAGNAVLHLAEALERIRCGRHLPVHLTPTFQAMVRSVSAQLKFPLNLVPGLLRSPVVARMILNLLPAESRGMLAVMITNTVTPTMLRAGVKANVVPSAAEATLDCRRLPGQSVEDVMREITATTGDQVTLEPLHVSAGAASPVDSPFYRVLETAARQMDPGGLVVPFLMPGGTDASEYQRAGIQMYGFTPGVLPPDFPFMTMAHGHDERLPIAFIRSGLPVLWEVLQAACVRPQ